MKVLIACPYKIGDGILASIVVNYYRSKYSNLELILVGPAEVLSLYQFLPEPKQLIIVEKTSSIKYWIGLRKRFKGQKFVVIATFHPALITQIANLLTSKVKVLPWSFGRFTKKVHMIELHRKLIDEKKPIEFRPFIYSDDSIKNNTKIEKDLVIINPNGSFYAKMWPNSSFISLFKKIFNNKKLNNLKFGIIGTKQDFRASELFDKLTKIDKSKRVLNLIGKYTIIETHELIKRSKIVITNDTSIMHLAAIVNKPLIALFGPTDYKKFAPLNYQNNPNIVSMTPKVDYITFRDEVGFNAETMETKSYMSHITVDMVYDKFLQIITNLELDKKAKRISKSD